MRLNKEQQWEVKHYILEKISEESPSLAASTMEAFGISKATFHRYLTELVEGNIITKMKRGKYKLVETIYTYDLHRSAGELMDDMVIYGQCLRPHISHLAPNINYIWSYAFSEMANNVIDHSCAENLHIVVSQDYLTTSVYMVDNGIGIFNKIQDHFGLASVEDAICELFKGKLTTDKENHSGEGIFFSSRMMDSFIIISENHVFTTNKYKDTSIFDIPYVGVNGTCVAMELSNFSKRTSKDVFDAYADVDGGFTRTRIPLKSIFDSAPISRSQAKRVCNRLESFKEVVIDFDGIPQVGQGFAHQMFFVFANSHPNIALTPINMCDDVSAMYNHVRAK